MDVNNKQVMIPGNNDDTKLSLSEKPTKNNCECRSTAIVDQ
jgi:hypothetical protein